MLPAEVETVTWIPVSPIVPVTSVTLAPVRMIVRPFIFSFLPFVSPCDVMVYPELGTAKTWPGLKFVVVAVVDRPSMNAWAWLPAEYTPGVTIVGLSAKQSFKTRVSASDEASRAGWWSDGLLHHFGDLHCVEVFRVT